MTASVRSVLSGLRRSAAKPSSSTPAAAKRIPAPSSAGASSSPILIATQVLDQMMTSSAYRPSAVLRDMAVEGTALFGSAVVDLGRRAECGLGGQRRLTGLGFLTMGCRIDVYLPTEDRGQELLNAITELLVSHGLGVGNDGKVHTVVALRSCEWSEEEMLDRADIDEAIAVSVPTNSGIAPPKLTGNSRR